MLASLLIALNATVIEPRAASWDELTREVFEPAWLLPADLPLAKDEDGLAWVLERELDRRTALVFGPNPADADAPRCFGDVVRDARGLDAAGIDALLARVARVQPALWSEIQPFARELLCDAALSRVDWDPDEDSRADGVLFARPLTLEGARAAPWNTVRGSRLVQQAAALVRADLATIKTSENDYTRYAGRPGTSYESIAVAPGSYLRGLDREGTPFSALRVRFESDLPFPYSSYRCDLRILNRVRWDGRVTCDIASPSKDFYWMAGRDVFVPLIASDGQWQAELVVRIFGFDLRGVPDGDSARRAGLRGSLGCLKREAEALFRARPESTPSPAGSLPAFRVQSGR